MNRQDFWAEVFRVHGSVSPYVIGRVAVFTLFGFVVWIFFYLFDIHLGMAVGPYEFIGAVLALLLVLRTNAGYDRWYEARKLWGGIVNQCRNLGTIGAVYGPQDPQWQDQFLKWTAAFPHTCRHSLRGESDLSDLRELLGPQETSRLTAAQHMPMYVAGRLAVLLRQAVQLDAMDRMAFLQAEHERTELIDHLGACERIMRTPLAKVYSIKIRRFLFLYLITLPLAIVDKTGLMTPAMVFIVAYPLLSLDQIGIELQSPFSVQRLSHLPLDEISKNIESNLRNFRVEPLCQPAPVRPGIRVARDWDLGTADWDSASQPTLGKSV